MDSLVPQGRFLGGNALSGLWFLSGSRKKPPAGSVPTRLASLSLGCGEERTYKRENGGTGGGKPLANPPYCGIIAAKRLLYRIMIAVFLAPCGATEKTWHNTIPALPSWYYKTTPAALGPRPPPTVPIHPVLTPRVSPEGKDDRYCFILARLKLRGSIFCRLFCLHSGSVQAFFIAKRR